MSRAPDRALEDVVEHQRNRFYGKYRGAVTDVDASTCRIKANVPSVLGDVVSAWCMPCVPYAGPNVGIAFLPEVGSAVWIEFEGGDVSFPIWVGCFWRSGEVPAGVAGNVKVIATAGSFKVAIDDGQQSMTLKDASGNSVTIDSSGITLARGGQQIAIADASVSVNNGALQVQ